MRRVVRAVSGCVVLLMLAPHGASPAAAAPQRQPAAVSQPHPPPAPLPAAKRQGRLPPDGAPLPVPSPLRMAVDAVKRQSLPGAPMVPLPLPRPVEIGGKPAAPPVAEAPTPAPTPQPKPDIAPEDSAQTPEPMEGEAYAACLKTFEAKGGEPMPREQGEGTSDGEGACTIPGAVTFSRIKLAEGGTVALESAVTVRCTLAVELAGWVREDLVPLVQRQGGELSGLTGVGGQACRPRNGQKGAQISEHASGNAFDLLGLKLKDGKVVELWKLEAGTKDLRAGVRESACARFRTVLGPGADSAHANHVHLDMRQRRNDFRMCQWNVD